jgi:cytochrome bd-type quinol oxidase subunit 1
MLENYQDWMMGKIFLLYNVAEFPSKTKFVTVDSAIFVVTYFVFIDVFFYFRFRYFDKHQSHPYQVKYL